MAREIRIREHRIKLGQLLKLARVVDSGSEVKHLLAHIPVVVNGEPEARRGRQLHPGDVVRVGNEELLVWLSIRASPVRLDPTRRLPGRAG